jgi:hypothetical protein
MKNTIIIALMIATFYSCSSSTKIDDKSISTTSKGNAIEMLYDFAETTDTKLCNRDSIIPTDCGGGSLYLTKKGNVIYQFFCFGNDTTSFSIGKYEMTDNGINCIFDQRYSYYSGSYDDEKQIQIDPNKGKLEKNQNWSMNLVKTECNEIDYSHETEDHVLYVFYPAEAQNSDFFFRNYKKIKILSEL